MRRLLLLRHATAAPAIGGDDFDRPLTESGRREAERVGEGLVQEGLAFDLVVCSAARRTRETARIVASRSNAAVETLIYTALYDATRHFVMALIRQLPDAAHSVLVVGHNPGISETANSLTGSGNSDARLQMAARYPPASLAALRFDFEGWADLQPRSGHLDLYATINATQDV